jgi:hypothetical protein
MDINTHEKMYERHCNRLLLDVLVCGYIQGSRGVNIPLEDWANTYRELTEKRRFNPDLFTEIHLPIMIQGEWMMIVCVPEKRIYKLVVFRVWPWNNEDVKSLLKMISVQLRRLVLDEGIKMTWQRHKELA